MIGPGHLNRRSEAEAPKSVVLVAVQGDDALETHLGELVDRARREPVAAGLLAGELFLLD